MSDKIELIDIIGVELMKDVIVSKGYYIVEDRLIYVSEDMCFEKFCEGFYRNFSGDSYEYTYEGLINKILISNSFKGKNFVKSLYNCVTKNSVILYISQQSLIKEYQQIGFRIFHAEGEKIYLKKDIKQIYNIDNDDKYIEY